MKTIYGNFSQQDLSAPTLISKFGDTYISLGFSDENSDMIKRLGLGHYQFFTGDELGQGNGVDVHLSATFAIDTAIYSYQMSVTDTMFIQLKCFDASGNPVDVNGNFSLSLVLNV